MKMQAFSSEFELRHEVYSDFLDHMELSDEHYLNLEERGLDDEQTLVREYKSVPKEYSSIKSIAEKLHHKYGAILFKVPGFYSCRHEDGSSGPMVHAKNGFLIPQRTKDKKIRAIYLRRDEQSGSGKYIHVSCKDRNQVELQPRVHWPLGKYSADEIYLTEGALKADISSVLLKKQVISLPGVTMWRLFHQELDELKGKTVRIANDRDLEDKFQVARPTAYLLRLLIQQETNVELVVWDNDFKGLDDALKSGVVLKNLTTTESKNYLEKVFQRLGLREIDWEGNGDIEVPLSDKVWMELVPLPEIYIPAPSFQESLLPLPMKNWVTDAADRMQSHPEFIAGTALVMISGLIGRRIGIKPKQKDNWKVIANLWGMIIGRPSLMKTPCISEARKAMDIISVEMDECLKEERVRWKAEEAKILSKKKSLEEKMKKAYSKDSPDISKINELRDDLKDLEAELEEKRPLNLRLYINDSTIEMVQELLKDNPNGLVYLRDELAGLIKSLEKTGRENDRTFLLEAWNGFGRYYVDRIGRGSFNLNALCLSILGGIQPEPLRKYLVQGADDGSSDDGFIQRFQILLWPEVSPSWECVDRAPDEIAFNRVLKVFRGINSLSLNSKEEEIPYLRFSMDAQKKFYSWQENLEKRLRSGDVKPSSLEAHLGKYRSLMPSLALVFHVIEAIDKGIDLLNSNVSLEAASMAIDWCEYLEGHANKVYRHAVSEDVMGATTIAEKIQDGKIRTGDTVRSIYRNKWSFLGTRKKVEAACDVLEQYGWARVIKKCSTKGGPTSLVIEVNPEVIELNY
jgi:hypothetical protein